MVAVEGVLLVGWACLHDWSPRGATVAVGAVAAVGILDVLWNLWIRSQTDWSVTIHPRFGVTVAAVAIAAGVVLARRRWLAVAVADSQAVRLPSRSAIRGVAVSLLVIAVVDDPVTDGAGGRSTPFYKSRFSRFSDGA